MVYKKWTILFVLICVLFGCAVNKDTKTQKLQEMCSVTDEKCLSELEKLGFKDIGVYETREETSKAAKEIIMFYAEGGTPETVPFSYTGMIEMAQKIWTVLDEYHF